MIHDMPLERRFLHGFFSRDLDPVLSVEPGDSVRISVPSASWEVEPGVRLDDPDDGHALAGPIEVRGARAGQVLAVRVDDVRPAGWGATYTEPPHLLLWELDGGRGRAVDRSVRLAPFLGVMGMPPPEPGRHPTRPPRRFGGNIDCKELVSGTTLFLPIPVDGACFSAGDGHAAQGDGEVSGSAIETPVEARMTLDVRPDLSLEWPAARTAGAWLTFGFHEQLEHAARIAVEGMLDLMERELAVGRDDALALASVVVDLRVTQVVNGAVGVHAVLSDEAFR